MFPFTTARLDKNEAFGSINVLWIERATLAMLYCQIIYSPIHELEGGQDLRQLTLGLPVEWQHVLELREGKHDIV